MKRLPLLLLVLGLAGCNTVPTAQTTPVRSDVLYLEDTEEARQKGAPDIARLFQGRQEVAFLDMDLSELQPPKPKRQVPAIYPLELKRTGTEGSATVEFIIDAQGDVMDAVASSSTDSRFAEAAVNAVRQWKFIPGRYHRTDIRIKSEVTLNFHLGPAPGAAPR